VPCQKKGNPKNTAAKTSNLKYPPIKIVFFGDQPAEVQYSRDTFRLHHHEMEGDKTWKAGLPIQVDVAPSPWDSCINYEYSCRQESFESHLFYSDKRVTNAGSVGE